jgi:hypothetical protein
VGQIQEWKQNANLGFQVSPISQLINWKCGLSLCSFKGTIAESPHWIS